MTALKPLENRRVRAVASERYPLNEVCAHPECAEPTADPHHIFPRSLIAGDSWFVVITVDGNTAELPDNVREHVEQNDIPYEREVGDPFPHVTGLCREHHDDLEEHRAWIKLEDGVFVWYARMRAAYENGQGFDRVSPLDPQPGGREKSRKPRRKFQGEARRQRRTISLRVPDDTEDGGAIWDETLEETKAKLVRNGLYSEDDKIPNYEAVIAGLRDWLNG